MPPQRSRTTCAQCRLRKVKCHHESLSGTGACQDCKRLAFQCSFTSTSSSPNATSLERKRNARACVQCRSQKTKCSGDLPSCAGCSKRGRRCIYPDSTSTVRKSPSEVNESSGNAEAIFPEDLALSEPSALEQGAPSIMPPRPAAASSSRTTSSPITSWRSPSSFHSQPQSSVVGSPLPLPTVREQLHLLTDFFRHVYPIPAYAFLNEVSVTQRCLDQTLDKSLLLSLCAISALHLGYSKYFPAFTSSWIKQAENLIWDRVEEPRIFTVQALLLITRYHVETSHYQKAFMLSSIAIRGATALRLQYERTDLSSLAQEIRRRLMWCLVMMDVGLSIGLPECELCNIEAVYLQFPCSEEEFDAEKDSRPEPVASVSLDGISENGLFALVIRTSMVRCDMMRLKRQIVLHGERIPQLQTMISQLDKTLQEIPMTQYTSAELLSYSRSRWLTRYLSLHLSWHQCYCDMYRLFMPGYAEAAPEAVTSACSPSYLAHAAKVCLQHASAVITILSDLAATPIQFAVADVDIAICGYHASRLILFLSRSDQKPADSNLTPERAASQAAAVLALLRRLFPPGPARLPARIILSLDAIINAHAANEGEPSRESPDMDTNAGDGNRRPRFALAAKQQQSLGIHSILRQTRFVDDSHDAANARIHGASEQATSALSQAEILPLTYQADDTNHLSTATYTTASMNFLQSPVTDMAAMSQLPLGMDPFIFGSMNDWNDLYIPNDLYATSDRDYF